MRLTYVLALTALASCATTAADLHGRAPKAELDSKLDATAAIRCLSDKISWLGTPSIIPGDGEQRVMVSGSGLASVEVDVSPAATGSHLKVRSMVLYNGRLRRDVESCLS